MGLARARILWLSHLVPYPPKAGVLIRSHHLLRELSRIFDVDLLAFNQSALMRGCFNDPEEGLRISRRELGTFTNILAIEPIPGEQSRYHRHTMALTSLFSRLPYSIRWLRSGGYTAAVATALASHKYDLVHVDTEGLIPHVPASLPCPATLDHHNIESHMLVRRSQNEPNVAKAAYFRIEAGKLLAFEKRSFRRFASHVVCSTDDRDRLLHIEPGARVFVAPNGVDFPEVRRFGASVQNGSPRLLFVGGLTWYPNHDAITHFLEDIWPALATRVPGISVDIVGRSPSAKIRTLADRHAGVRLHGFVQDISAMYAAATAYICPIRDGGGTKLKVVDAIANCLPMIAHPVACEGLQLVHGEHVFFARTAEEYATAVMSIQNDSATAAKMAQRAYEFAHSRYSSAVVGASLARHYLDLIEESRSRTVQAVS